MFYSEVYGDALQIDGSTSYDSTHGYGVVAGGNAINFYGNGGVCGDAGFISGDFSGGNNQIHVGGDPNFPGPQGISVFGTAEVLSGSIVCGNNVILFYGYDQGGANYTIYGDAVDNYGLVSSGGKNTISGWNDATIYGDCFLNIGQFVGGFNTITAGTGNCTIYGDFTSNTGNFSGGHNTIYAGSGNEDIWGGQAGFDSFVFRPGTGQVTIEDFDHHAGSTFSHAQGDVIDLSAYNLGGMQNLAIGANASGDAMIYLPDGSLAAGSNHSRRCPPAGSHSERFPLLTP
jgi:hypothetical protein